MYRTMTARRMARLLVDKHGYGPAVNKATDRRYRYEALAEGASHIANAPARRALRFKYSERAVWWKCVQNVVVAAFGRDA